MLDTTDNGENETVEYDSLMVSIPPQNYEDENPNKSVILLTVLLKERINLPD